MTFPAHEARFTTAPSRLIAFSLRRHRLKEFEQTSHTQKADRRKNKPRPRPVPHEVHNSAHTRQSSRRGHDLPHNVVPERTKHIGRRVWAAGVPALKELHRSRE